VGEREGERESLGDPLTETVLNRLGVEPRAGDGLGSVEGLSEIVPSREGVPPPGNCCCVGERVGEGVGEWEDVIVVETLEVPPAGLGLGGTLGE